jgi:hypothetical protein
MRTAHILQKSKTKQNHKQQALKFLPLLVVASPKAPYPKQPQLSETSYCS